METKPDDNVMSDIAEIKACCANVYQSDWARLLLGDSFHPGGPALTTYLGTTINLGPGLSVLDIASGPGTSAILLAQRFGCSVLGIDYGYAAIEHATQVAAAAGVAHLVSFRQGDAEHLPVSDSSYDAVICECAFCTFPAKPMAASEFARVLKPGGRLGLSDLTRTGAVPEDLRGLLAWIACIADAQPLAEYTRYLTEAGLSIDLVESHDAVLAEMVHAIQGKLLGAELLVKLKKIDLPGNIDFAQARNLVKSASVAIKANQFGYAIISATRPA